MTIECSRLARALAMLFASLVLAAFAGAAAAQDTLVGLGKVHGYTGEVFDTTKTRYDILVDQSKPDDPAAHRYHNIHAAYIAAPAGARDKPTVIGLLPDVYQLSGTLSDPGLTITKANLTLVGLTDDRRKVVLADNRGNKQGADNNGWSLAVDADGFTAINLTFLNYCNVDYDYPGDPSRSLKKRSSTITQALALRASGDRHVYSHVAFLSRLDTFGNRATRSYFTHAYLEGTDDFLGQREAASVWEDSEIQFSNPGGILFGGGTTFIRTRFRASKYIWFYKVVVPPDAFIDSILPNAPLAWHAWRQLPTLNEPSVLYRTVREDGRPVKASEIIDSAIGLPRRTLGRELTEEQVRAFNPWNVLRWTPTGIDDGWDPAGARAQFETFGVLPTRITLTNGSPRIRTTEAAAQIGAKVLPAGATHEIYWSTGSKLVKLSSTTGDAITVTGANTTDKTQTIPIRVSADNGFSATAWVTVDPAYQAPPKLTGAPKLSFAGDSVAITYALNLSRGRKDQSLVSWFVCEDKSCRDPRRFAVSRADRPLKTVALTPAMAGLHVMASVEPKDDLSQAGAPVRVVSEGSASAVKPANTVSLDITTLPDTEAADRWEGDWRLTGAWISDSPMDGEVRWGLRAGRAVSTMVYTGRRAAQDQDVIVELDTDKLEGQAFGIPGTPADDSRVHGDIYFKYDAASQTGYALRMWRTTQSSEAVMLQVYRIVGGKGAPIGNQQLSGVIKPTTKIAISVRGGHVAITGSNTTDGATLSLSADIEPNGFAGAGLWWPGAGVGGSAVVRSLKVVDKD